MNDKERVLDLILRSPKSVSRGDICAATGISTSSAGRYLDELRQDGEIERIGEGRASAYRGDAADVYDYCKESQADRKKIPYNHDRIIHYPVAGTSYFTPEQKRDVLACSRLPIAMTQPDYIESIKRRLLLEASWSSSKLEGNTYSLLDTEELFDRNAEMPGARIEETRMLLNHKHAIEYTLNNIESVRVANMDILNIHSLLSDGLLKDPSDSGKIRSRPVGITGSTYEPLHLESQIKEEFHILLKCANKIQDPFDKSMYLFLNLAYLQPFQDVNKRTSRMVSNIPLLKASLMPMSFFQMSRKGYERGLIHYYETGDSRRMVKEYVDSYRVSAARFRDIIENKPTPRELGLRLKYRREIVAAVKAIVINAASLDTSLPPGASDEDKIFLADYIQKCVRGLSESNAILYGLSTDDIKNHLEEAENGAGRLVIVERPRG